MLRLANYVGGELVPPIDGEYLDNIDPATGEVYSSIPDSGRDDVERAVIAASNAFPAWSRTPAAERSRMLLAIADLIEDNLEELALAECVDTGKPLALARAVDIPRAIANFRFFATAILHFNSESHRTDGVALNYTLRDPSGVAGLISPWNLPLYLLSWKIAPALASGNTAVAKPSEITPMTAFRLSELCVEAGLPPGVLNIVHGTGPKAGAAIVDHPGIKAISFTGSTATGAEIARRAAPRFVKLSLEMGGKNPNIVFADADLDEVLATSIRSSFSNQGQICLCGSRILVEESIYPEFLDRFVAETRRLKVGDPLEPDSDQGAIVSRAQLEKVRHYVDLAREDGGSILAGGAEPADVPERCRNGYFFQPTVIADLDPSCRVNQEEIFGPVVTVIPFSDEAQAVEYANGTEYGLAASIWTQNLSRAHRVAEQVESGIIWVNCWMLRDLRTPFGGMKNSGVGREGGDEALRFFTEPKNVCVKISDSTRGS